uniref:Protein FAM114A2 n=1 Tax=Cacopsylla melanoneura TaxID=428564 RepID=A0A8D9F0R2_9HEMI
MSSDSESDEQFESADEEFDVEIESPQSIIPHEVTKQVAQLNLKEKSVQEIKSLKSDDANIANTIITSPEEISQPSPDKINNVSKIPDSINESKSVEIDKEKTPNIEKKSLDHVSNSTKSQESKETNEDEEPKTTRKTLNDSKPKHGNVSSLDKKTEQSNTNLTSVPDTKSPDIIEKEPNISISKNESIGIKEKEPNTSNVNTKSEHMKEKVNAITTTKPTDIKAKEPSVDFEIDGWDVDIEDDINNLLPNIQSSEVGDHIKDALQSTQGNELPTSNISKNKGEAGDQRGIHSSEDDNRSVKKTSNEDIKSKSSLNEKIKDANSGADTDGWDVDVEVEDGFEIPVNLNKASSGSSQTTNERFTFSLTSPLQKLSDSKDDSWGGWGGWGGVGNILSTATSGVSTLTSQVSQGITTALGAPDPAELAKQLNQVEQHNAEQQTAQSTIPEPSTTQSASTATESASTGLFSLSQLTRLVETTGSKVISGGLDTLENLGKKTMEVLQDGDPGLKRKRAILFPNQDKPILSQVLRDAKSRQETQDRKESQENMNISSLSSSPGANTSATSVKNLHFETLLDDYQGLSHLEALEILSKQCSMKLHNALMGEQDQQMNDYQETLQQIREMCQVDDATDIDDRDETEEEEEDEMGFDEKIEEIVRLYDLTSKLNCDKLIKVNKKLVLQVDRLPLQSSCDILYSQCLHAMAEFTSIAMELFHKSASLLLLKSKHRTVDETDALTQLTHLLCSRITKLSTVYSQSMMKLNTDSPLITNIYLEAANSCSYLQDASQLLIPVLQIVALPGGAGGGFSL